MMECWACGVHFYPQYKKGRLAGSPCSLCNSCSEQYLYDMEHLELLPKLRRPWDDGVWARLKMLQAQLLSDGLTEEEVKERVNEEAKKCDEEYFERRRQSEEQQQREKQFTSNLAREIHF